MRPAAPRPGDPGVAVRLQDAMHIVLHARAMPHDLIAPGDETAKPLGPLVGNTNLRQQTAGVKLRQNTGIDLVGLDPGMGDRLS